MGDVFGISDGLERVTFFRGFAFGFGSDQRGGEGSIGEGRCDRVDSDFWSEFGGEGFGQTFDCGFGGSDGSVEAHALGDGDG